jgi:hypothetical protein
MPGEPAFAVAGKKAGASLRYDFTLPGNLLFDSHLIFVFENFPFPMSRRSNSTTSS